MQPYRTVCGVRILPKLANERRKRTEQWKKKSHVNVAAVCYRTLMTSCGEQCEARGVRLHARVQNPHYYRKGVSPLAAWTI